MGLAGDLLALLGGGRPDLVLGRSGGPGSHPRCGRGPSASRPGTGNQRAGRRGAGRTTHSPSARRPSHAG